MSCKTILVLVLTNFGGSIGVMASDFGILNTLYEYQEWAEKEEAILAVLEKRIELIDAEIELIDKYLEDYQESTGEAMLHLKEPKNTPEERGRVVGSSAVLGHRMTSRYAGVIVELRKLLSSSEYQENENNLSELLERDADSSDSSKWIGRTELFMSMESLIRIQEIFCYLPDGIQNGFGLRNESGVQMSDVECAEMGVFALYRKNYKISIEWLLFAVNRTLKYTELKNDLAIALMKTSIQEHNRVLNKKESEDDDEIQMNLFTEPVRQPRFAKRNVFRNDKHGGKNLSHPTAQFMNLCRGNISQTPSTQKSLKCFYENRRHPYLYINPVKVEHLSESPPIYQFYEMIGVEATQSLHAYAKGYLLPSPMLKNSNSFEALAKIRTSVSVGVGQEDIPETTIKLADMVTGLIVWNNESPVQYVEYTYGRFYTYHSDIILVNTNATSARDDVATYGDRLATILYYLEVPESGGSTPFYEAGVFARPVRGSAVFWYNLYKNGTARRDVTHGSCPVLHGHKIIANHWIRHFSNWRHYKCSLNQHE